MTTSWRWNRAREITSVIKKLNIMVSLSSFKEKAQKAGLMHIRFQEDLPNIYKQETKLLVCNLNIFLLQI